MVVSAGGGSRGVWGFERGSVEADGGTGDVSGEEQAVPNIAAGINRAPTTISNPNHRLRPARLFFILSSFSNDNWHLWSTISLFL